MRSSTLLALAALGLAASAHPAEARTLLVPQQFPTIQKALDAAKPYDTVLVSAKPKGAVYNEAVTIKTPHVVLQGQNNPVIDGTGLGTPQPNPFTPGIYLSCVDIRAAFVAVRGVTVQNAGASGVNVGYTTADGSAAVSYGDIEISNVTARSNNLGIAVSGASGLTDDPNGLGSLKNYKLLSNTVTGSAGDGIFIGNTSGAVISGNRLTGNGYDGLGAFGSGLSILANETASNGNSGMRISAVSFNPAVSNPKSPNPASSLVGSNTIHDNKHFGLDIAGTVTVFGNFLTNNVGYGLILENADYSAVTFNVISGTTKYGFGGSLDDGTGLVADTFGSDSGGPVSVSANNITGNASDGVFLENVGGYTLSLNQVTGNAKVGIHASDYPVTDIARFLGVAPNVITRNLAYSNTVLDARDDASATDPLVYKDPVYSFLDVTFPGDGVPTINLWTKNLFGTTSPVGLSK